MSLKVRKEDSHILVTSYVIDSTVDDSLGIFTKILRDSALLSINKRDLSNSVGAVVKHHSINSNELLFVFIFMAALPGT
jgi:hypothetical protein